MLLVGPLFSALWTEADGRRTAFLVLGALMLVMTPFIAAGGGRATTAGIPSDRHRNFQLDLLIAAAMLPASALVLVTIPAGFGFDNYLVAAGAIALIGMSALIVPALPPLVSGLALIAAAVVLTAAPEALAAWLITGAMSGLAVGATIKSAGEAARRPWPAMALGVGGALIAAGLSEHFHWPFPSILAGVALVLIALQVTLRLSPVRQPA
jgi:hypothetical protein